jgi:multimeric flavodoxin WrbA
MRVLLVNGSPHQYGCTFTAINEVAQSLNDEGIETGIFWIGNRPIRGCIDCKTCVKKHRCAFNDDKVNEFLDMALDYDGFVFGSPVHWAAAGGAVTSFLDRAFYADFCGGNGAFRLKPAAAVVNARRAGTTATWDQLNKYFGLMQMPIVTSRYWNMTHGFTPDEVRQDLEGMQTMRILGKNMAFFLKCKKMAMDAGLQLPEQEKSVYTNFIRE